MPLTRTCGPRICHVADVRAEDIPLIEHPGFAEHHYSSLVRRDGMFPANCQLFWSPEAMKRYAIWSVDFTKEDCVKGLQNCGLLWVHDKSDHFFPLFTPKPMAQGGSSPGNVVWTHGNSYASNDNFRRLLQFMDEAGLAYAPPLPKPLNSAQLPDLSGLYEVIGVATPTPGRITGLPNNDLVKAQAANSVSNKVGSVAARRAYLNEKFDRAGDLNLDINIRGRQEVATNFFRSQGIPEGKIDSFFTGIDFTQPVEIQTIGSGKKLWQYQSPGAPQGSWYSLSPSVEPTQLGISPYGFNRAAQSVEPKVLNNYVTTESVSVLHSTSAAVDDFWSVSGQSYPTTGGATQLFSPQKQSFILIPGN